MVDRGFMFHARQQRKLGLAVRTFRLLLWSYIGHCGLYGPWASPAAAERDHVGDGLRTRARGGILLAVGCYPRDSALGAERNGAHLDCHLKVGLAQGAVANA